jgi:hypothetical protein
MRRPVLLFAAAIAVLVGILPASAGAAAHPSSRPASAPARFDAMAWRARHGYLPLRGVATLERAKAHAAAMVAAQHHLAAPPAISPGAPKIGSSWEGDSGGGNPPDANGAVGPKSYIEIDNTHIGIYKRDGSLISSATLFQLVGHSNIGDPTIIWDPHTQRFFFSLIGLSSTLDWGFSKTSNPATIPGDFCTYETNFGFPTGSIPDYPKLGQTKGFLMIGLNLYLAGSEAADEGDVAWISKQQGSGQITTCPGASSFKSGVFHDLRNQDGSQGFTPVPAIQTDPSGSGYVVAMSDIECPPTCGKGTLMTTYTLKPSKNNPKLPALSKPASVKVGTYKSPPDAPQKGTDQVLDTLDGRITHAVSGMDPKVGKVTVWVSHCVLGGAGAKVRWYELQPGENATLIQSGDAKDNNLYVFNGGVSNDRTVNASGKAAHGDAMVLGFNTSSSSTYPAVQMVSKIGNSAQSAFVLVHQSKAPLEQVSCGNLGCRWGDYSGATPDPAAAISGAHGEVWLTSEYTDGDSLRPTWNWEALP